ncbi:hypothetical protein SAMN05445756_0589 [Kytococcus aerolatus]|uniref:Uncharacterized protein n=1 Tax=Kytococcus aerolatus TaxID=592308 RepID=A0A212T7D7_9MICO|nr:hypothetical protein SAMN05445756_0589 [Kytococcus aerolatus]
MNTTTLFIDRLQVDAPGVLATRDSSSAIVDRRIG